MSRRPAMQPLLCASGFHQVPPPRDPPGAIVAICPTCGKGMYCYASQHSLWNATPNLLVTNFPRVLGPLSSG